MSNVRPLAERLLSSIPTRDRVDLSSHASSSIAATTDLARHEMIVLDNGSTDPATLAYFEQVAKTGVRVFKVGGAFQFRQYHQQGRIHRHRPISVAGQ